MTVYGSAHTFLDVISQTDEAGRLLPAVNLAAQSYPEIADAVVKEGNMRMAEKTLQTTGLPSFSKRKENAGVAPTKPTYGTQIDTMMALEANSEVDELSLEGVEDPEAYLTQRGNTYFESGSQAGAFYTWYGDEGTADDEFTGFTPRNDAIGDYCLDAGGSSNLCSLHIINWDREMGACFIYPRGTTGGLRRVPGGRQRIADAVGGGQAHYWAIVETFMWRFGLSVKRPDAHIRIANIDVEEVLGVSGAQTINSYSTNVLYLIETALSRVYNPDGRVMIYGSRSLIEGLARQASARVHTNVFKREQIDGMGKVMACNGKPVRTSDQLTTSESAVT